ncbi:branched-chain amino acid ABC transporter permease [Thermobispora bispora]|uniref:Inner-membrane translocator n=1 Tax=Thermobispora bispora (strain ATCC 19993 / DSM 43833 / CBS 139.67 / JCM 10125 / KCTC 9307 / NBRC 14880 / R51) TaxID=469371 RepID=D6Y495_THEBD|nr:branched-chain amino acid ABC transporter permease [Thermobispora bispora]MBO2475887.1 branched-chain amino acid ABC transporter permease [Actinomycetales bacterium]MDI9581579.1 branched-chain amino acid ABC transporter permease [Thermobispora sp.]ADG87149.1 inner-membrane translocator [Thermobispora bispora DSM 43833]MBX6167706.1 branched-chain amino acid ABC transporter permease [Thermobispora bispora]QSI47114.1 branched-chain amino acid ABC transporter permease [Thermobispora bispora]
MTDQMIRTRPAVEPRTRRGPRAWAKPVVLAALPLLAAALPYLDVQVPLLFDGPLGSPGVLHVLSLMCVMAAVAVTYDLLFGFTGLLSFGHGLYVALGMYTTGIVLTHTDLGFAGAVAWVAVLGLVVPLVLGAICLRVGGIAFAMATLAFGQAGAIFVVRDPLRITGGELGLALPYEKLPEPLVGVINAGNRYWLALALLVVTYAVVRWALASRPGRVWRAIRDNETRVLVLGLRPYAFKLMAFVLSSFLASLAGLVYALIAGGAHAEVTEATFTLGLLVMVVLGGSGHPYGALIGGLVYTYLNHRLGQLSTTLGGPLSEPLFILGVLFVVLILFLPGGIVSLVRRTESKGGA